MPLDGSYGSDDSRKLGTLESLLDPAGGLGGPSATDMVLGLTGVSGARAAERAGRLQSEAMVEAANIAAGSQERGLQALMEQLGLTRESFAPFLDAGTGALSDLERGSTAGGLSENISEILGGDLFGDLRDERERSVRGQLSAGGLTRSGAGVQAMADVPTDLAMQIENMLYGRSQGLANVGLNAAAQTGGLSGGMSSQIASMLSDIGGTRASGIMGSARATAAGTLGAAQSQAQGTQNLLNSGIAAYAAFSDPRLKENIKVVGKADKLDIVTWDWIKEVKDSFVSKCNTIGFLSTQVKEFYPQFVSEFGGFDVIDYNGLHKELRCP